MVQHVCEVCGAPTELQCSDCAISFRETSSENRYVCGKSACMDVHEQKAKCYQPPTAELMTKLS